MAVDYQRQDDVRLVIVRFEDEVTATEVHATLEHLASTGAWSYGVIYDERDARVALSSADIRRLTTHAAALTREHGPRGPVAVVALVDVDDGMIRVLSAFAEMAGYEIHVFRTMAAAVHWIGTVRR